MSNQVYSVQSKSNYATEYSATRKSTLQIKIVDETINTPLESAQLLRRCYILKMDLNHTLRHITSDDVDRPLFTKPLKTKT